MGDADETPAFCFYNHCAVFAACAWAPAGTALRAVNDARQLLETYTVKIMPGRLPAPQKDGFGNTVFWCSIGSAHNILRYGSRGIARVEEPGQPAPPPNPCLRFAGLRTKPGKILMQVSSAMRAVKRLPRWMRFATPYTAFCAISRGNRHLYHGRGSWREGAACARITRTFL